MVKYKFLHAVVGITVTKSGDRIVTGPSFIRSVHDTREEASAARVEMDDSLHSFITPELNDMARLEVRM